jgi:hypothetical protein
MQRLPLRLALALALLASAFLATNRAALAQPVDGQKTEELKKQDPVPPATAPKLSEQAGTTEPSGKVSTTSPDPNAVFVNGVLSVPGASSDVDTAPAKHWARSNADDQIPIAGYRLKALKADQLQLISRELSSQRDAPTASPASGAYAQVGAEVPADIALQSLSQVPDTLANTFSELRGTAFMRSGGKIVIVDPKNNLVVGVLEG